jgi:hypothetical protein
LSLSNRRSTAHYFFGFHHPPIRHQNPQTLDLAYKKFKNLTLLILCCLPLLVAEDTAKLYLYGKAFVTILWAPISPFFFSVLNVAAPPLNAIDSCDVYFRRYRISDLATATVVALAFAPACPKHKKAPLPLWRCTTPMGPY